MRSRSTISQRSTLTDFTSNTVTRGSANSPHESIARTVRTTSTRTHQPRAWYFGGISTSVGFSVGTAYVGIGTHYPYHYRSHFHRGFYFGSHVYHGSFATAWLSGTAWHITPSHSYGWFGYNFGPRYYHFPRHHFRHHHRFRYRGTYCRVYRPYWYGASNWYSYRPYRYGYSSYVYDRIYNEGYDDGYGRGYNRGYVDGAEEVSAYGDDRRRDSIDGQTRPRVPDPAIDRAKEDAATEYRYEMNRGTEAFEEGDFSGATKSFKEALILSPNSSDARYSLAVSAFAEGKFAFAAFALRRGISLSPEGSDFDVAAAFGDPVVFQALLDDLDGELQEFPDNPDLLLISGFIELRAGDASEAARKLDHALSQSPQDKAAAALHKEALDRLENE